MAKRALKKKHIVIFQDEEGNVLKTSFVEEGAVAEGPAMPKIKEELPHHQVVFAGWEHENEAVTSNLVIKPVYKKIPKQYIVMYFGENGKMLGTEKVSYGEAANAAYRPVKKRTKEFQYTFCGWNQDLSHIEQDMIVKPVFAKIRRKYKVTFLGDQDEILSVQEIKYGYMPKTPAQATKKDDPVYFYEFSGWDKEISPVTGEESYRAVFDHIYKEYVYKAYLESEGGLIKEQVCHYGDTIELPEINKKGYKLIWDNDVRTITRNENFHGSWEFTNKKNSLIENHGSIYKIINPSISSGTVSCIQFTSRETIIKMPEKVKLGDYYYKIIRIEKYAFSGCMNLKQLQLADTVEVIEDRAFGKCPKLNKITFGRNTKILGKQIFYGCRHLRKMRIKGSKIKKVAPQIFDQFGGKVTVKADNILNFRLEKMFAKGITGGSVSLG